MTEQQYRVIADATMKDLQTGDLAVVRVAEGFEDGAWSAEPGVVRIERPVPTTDEPKRMLMTHPHNGHGPDDTCRDCESKPDVVGLSDEQWARIRASSQPSPHPPTREQIAEAAYYAEKRADYGDSWTERWEDESEGYRATYYAIADAVLALIQNGADRG